MDKKYLWPRSWPNTNFKDYHRHERSYYITLDVKWLTVGIAVVEAILLAILFVRAL